MRPAPLIHALIQDGRLGRKNGRGLFRYDKGKKKGPDPTVYAETYNGDKPRTLRGDTQQIVYNAQPQSWEFYDLVGDPEQMHDVFDAESPRVQLMRTALRGRMKGADLIEMPEPIKLDGRTREALKSLGYLN